MAIMYTRWIGIASDDIEYRVSALSRYGTGVLPSKMLALSKLCKHFE